METGVHSSKDDGASAAADWACSSSWAGAWSTNDDWSGELWTPLPPKMQIENCDWQNNAADDVDLAGDDAVEVWRQAHRKFNFTGYVLLMLNFL